MPKFPTDKYKEDIDFVILWVDGSDPKWQAEYDAYSKKHIFSEDLLAREKISGKRRYRDWGMLRYIFRSIDTCTPWVRRIHLITCRHFPVWLNKGHPKLNLLTHHDIFRVHSHLPTFNTNAIHANLDGIKALAEQFVLFDDDTLILRKTPSSHFFEKGLPRDRIEYNTLYQWDDDRWWIDALHRNMLKIHSHFKLNALKVIALPLIHPAYGKKLNRSNFRKFLSSLIKNRSAFFSPLPVFHRPRPILKQCMIRCIQAFKDDFIETSRSRFRGTNDMLINICQYWHLLERKFIPFFEENESRVVKITNYKKIAAEADDIFKPDVRFLCINDDAPDSISPEEEFIIREMLVKKMEELFPVKSAFEN